MEDLQHKFVQVNGVRLHYVESGDDNKELLVFLHGWPEFWYSWRQQLKYFKNDYHVIAPDLRGFNESDKPKPVGAYKTSIVAKDIEELIKKVGHKKATIVGHDWGGAVTWSLIQKFPDVVERAFILNCPEPSTMISNLRKNPNQMLKSWYMFFFQIPIVPEILLKIGLREIYKREVKGRAFNASAFDEDDLEMYVKAMQKKDAISSSIKYYKAGMAMAFSSDREKENNDTVDKRPPIHLIWGEGDHVLSKDMILETKKKLGKEVTLDFIPNCSHWVQNDAADQVNAIIEHYLQ